MTLSSLGSEPQVCSVKKIIYTFHPSRASWIPKLVETDTNQKKRNILSAKICSPMGCRGVMAGKVLHSQTLSL